MRLHFEFIISVNKFWHWENLEIMLSWTNCKFLFNSQSIEILRSNYICGIKKNTKNEVKRKYKSKVFLSSML